VALTMQGFWWPGRQLVVVLPLAVLVVLVWLARAGRVVVGTAAVLAAAGVGYYAALLGSGYLGDTTWVFAPDELALHWPAALLLPDDRDLTTADRIRYAGWLVLTALLALRTARRSGRAPAASRTSR